MPKDKAFLTESALCAAFVAALPPGWTSYAETCGWDLLLVRRDGFQVGIQAKLKLNPFVLAQALDESQYSVDSPGPDCRAVLVPWGEISVGLAYLCAYVGVTILRMSAPTRANDPYRRRTAEFEPTLPILGTRWSERDWYEQAPSRRCKLPEYIPDVAAGVPSPVQLTEWKVAAIKIAVLLEERGHITRADFRSIGIDHRRWIAPGNDWLAVSGDKFVPGKKLPRFRQQHPIVYEQVKADIAKWRPRDKKHPPEQEALL